MLNLIDICLIKFNFENLNSEENWK